MKKWCAALFLSIGLLLRVPAIAIALPPEKEVYQVQDFNAACEYLLEQAIECKGEIWLRLDDQKFNAATRDKLFFLLPSYRIAELRVEVWGDIYKLIPAYKSCVRMLNASRGNQAVRLNEQEQAALQEAYRVLEEVKASAKTPAEVALALHDWIVLHSEYDSANANFDRKYAEGEYSPFDGKYLLLEHKGVCDSYVQAYWLMLQLAGVPCSMMSGQMLSDGQGHAWNLVKMGDHWAHVDTTFDDPVPDQPGVVLHTCFDKTDAEMAESRRWDKSIFPSAQGSALFPDGVREFESVEACLAALREAGGEVVSWSVQIAELRDRADADDALRAAALQAALPGALRVGHDPLYPRALRIRYSVPQPLTESKECPKGAATTVRVAPEQP